MRLWKRKWKLLVRVLGFRFLGFRAQGQKHFLTVGTSDLEATTAEDTQNPASFKEPSALGSDVIHAGFFSY